MDDGHGEEESETPPTKNSAPRVVVTATTIAVDEAVLRHVASYPARFTLFVELSALKLERVGAALDL